MPSYCSSYTHYRALDWVYCLLSPGLDPYLDRGRQEDPSAASPCASSSSSHGA